MRSRSNALTVLAPALIASGCLVVASPSLAQQARPGATMGMRYLSWTGKVERPETGAADGLRRSAVATAEERPAAAAARYPGIQSAQPVSRPSRYGVGTVGGAGRGPTPASVWTGDARPSATAPTPLAPIPSAPRGPIAVYPGPQGAASGETNAPASAESQARQAPAPAAAPPPAPDRLTQQADAETSAYDPMAPRRDAPIFRMQQAASRSPSDVSAPEPQAGASLSATGTELRSPVLTQPVAGRTPGGQAYAGAEPPREGPRYYSVQRAVGRQPDPIAMPESIYLDNAPIDLAEPPATPVRTRTVNGQAQVVIPNQDPNLP